MKRAAAGRIALRVEGEWWNAYWAPRLSMKGAVLLAAIRMSVAADPAVKTQFIELAKAAFASMVRDTTGSVVARWDEPYPAPESERGGNA